MENNKCHQKIPLLNDIHNKFKDEVVVIGITDEDKEKIIGWLKTKNVEYYIAIDHEAKYRTQIGVQGNKFKEENKIR